MPLGALQHLLRHVQTFHLKPAIQQKLDYPATTPAADIKRPAELRYELQSPLVLRYSVVVVELRAIPVFGNLVVTGGGLLRSHGL